jgi:hypothetical protein
MDAISLAAFASFALAALISAAFGVLYLVRPRFMPYHQQALGLTWEELDHRLQALLLGLMRVAGGGMLAGGLSVAILLLVPFRAGEIWATYAILLIGLAGGLPALYATTLIRSRTQAHTPIAASAIGVGLLVLGTILSLV